MRRAHSGTIPSVPEPDGARGEAWQLPLPSVRRNNSEGREGGGFVKMEMRVQTKQSVNRKKRK